MFRTGYRPWYAPGMTHDLDRILGRFSGELAEWLEQPTEATARIAELRGQVESLVTEIEGGSLDEALKAFSAAESQVGEQRRRTAAAAIIEACAKIGISLHAHSPFAPGKRKRRAKKPTT